MVGKGRSLKFALHIDQPHGLGDISGMGIYKTNVLIRTDVFRHFRGQLQVKREFNPVKFRKFIFIRFRRCQAEFEREGAENVPGYTVILAVGVPVTQY